MTLFNIFKSVLNIFLIGLIFLQIPKESLGLRGSEKSNNFLNLLIGIGVLIYFGLALELNIKLDLYYFISNKNDLGNLTSLIFFIE